MTHEMRGPWAPLSRKHREYIRLAAGQRMCVAEGAIRSGKTIDHCIIARRYLEKCEDGIHLASGSSAANAKLNIGVCNGFGLESQFAGRCRWGKYRDNEALFLDTASGLKIVIFVGGGKADSYRKILGSSFGLWIATEINEHYDCEDSRESFIKVAFGRQAAARRPLTLWDMNPSEPGHPIYSQYVDKYRQGLPGGYLYRHFTMADNLSISPQRQQALAAQYQPGSLWYRRDILGQRVRAEGAVYAGFIQRREALLAARPDYDFVQVGVDFGGNRSAFAFVAVGLKRDCSVLTALRSERHPAGGVTPEKMYRLLEAFLHRVRADWGPVAMLYADSAEQTLINGIRARFDLPVRNSLKGRIMERVRATNLLVDGGRFYYTGDCRSLADALCSAVYDPKQQADARLDDGSSDIDTLDAFEYAWERYLNGYVRRAGKNVEAGEGDVQK